MTQEAPPYPPPADHPLVIYHDHCADGFCAAWCAWRVLGDDAIYQPASYGQEPPSPEITGGRAVYILDFSYKKGQLLRLALSSKCVIVLDHHATAATDLEGLPRLDAAETFRMGRDVFAGEKNLFCRFDLGHSGARLAHDYFCSEVDRPWLVDYVEDRDLWTWKLYESRAVSAWLSSHEWSFEFFDRVAYRGPQTTYFDGYVTEGRAIERYKKRQVADVCKQAQEVLIAGHPVLAANTPVNQSEVAGRLAESRLFGACWHVDSRGVKHWSLRSTPAGIDVSLVAKSYGGGGHPRAAGFEGEI